MLLNLILTTFYHLLVLAKQFITDKTRDILGPKKIGNSFSVENYHLELALHIIYIEGMCQAPAISVT